MACDFGREADAGFFMDQILDKPCSVLRTQLLLETANHQPFGFIEAVTHYPKAEPLV